MALTSEVVADENGDDSSPSRLYTLYFIRHAEALHNQLEKQAQKEALALAISQGYDHNSSFAKQVQEEARQSILKNDNIQDPPLSELGMEEAKNAKRSLEILIERYDLPKAEEVWVSPLQRALQTANTIFPDSDCGSKPIIRIKKQIEERQTGMACDIHKPFKEIRKRTTYNRFAISSLRLELEDELNACDRAENENKKLEEVETDNGTGAVWDRRELLSSTKTSSTEPSLLKSDPNPDTVEDKSMLRERTKQLFDMLAETNSRTICLIGHKGYLRELERGPLGKPEAELFKNCEVRVYKLQLDIFDGVMDGAGLVADEDLRVGCDDNSKGSSRASSGLVGGFDRLCVSSGSSDRDRDSMRSASSHMVIRRVEKLASSLGDNNNM